MFQFHVTSFSYRDVIASFQRHLRHGIPPWIIYGEIDSEEKAIISNFSLRACHV